MKAEDTVLDTIRIYNITGVDVVEVGQWRRIRPILEAQAEISFKAGIDYEQKQMTKALRKLHKKVWTLAGDTVGQLSRQF